MASPQRSPEAFFREWEHRAIARWVVVFGIGCVGTFGCGQEHPTPDHKNVVLITVDTLRADHLGYAGYSRKTSPNIDALAANSVRFDNALTQWPKTSPSVASMMSSTHARAHGVRRMCGQRLPDGLVLLSQILAADGYETAAFVSNRFIGEAFGFNRGFQSFHEVWHGDRDDAGAVTTSALRWFDRRDRHRPFFLWVHYLDPHAPYSPPEDLLGLFPTDESMTPNKPLRFSASDGDVGEVPSHAQLEGLDDLREYVARYDGEIRFVDTWVGRLLDEIGATGIGDSTMVVFTADHGESLGDHNYYFEHGRFPYDACLHVPLLIKVPWALPSGVRVSQPVGLIDVAPTILDAVRIAVPPQFTGTSLIPVVSNPGEQTTTSVFAEAGYTEQHQTIVRKGRWKLISIPDTSDRALMTGSAFELYDVVDDPSETTNSVFDHPEVFAELVRLLEEWEDRVPAAPDAAKVSLMSEERSALKALGYVEEVAAMH